MNQKCISLLIIMTLFLSLFFAGCSKKEFEKNYFCVINQDCSQGSGGSIFSSDAINISDSLNVSAANNGGIAKTIGLLQNTSSSNYRVVKIPANTVLNIINGDLSPSGTFTTIAMVYGTIISGLSGLNQIASGQVILNSGVSGTYNYLGTDYQGGSLVTGILKDVNAVGTIDGNILQIQTGSLSGNISNIISVVKSSFENIFADSIDVIGGIYSGVNFLSLGINGTVTGGTFNTGLNQLSDSTVSISNNCLNIYATGINYNISGDPDFKFTSATLTGDLTGTINGILFTPTLVESCIYNDTNDYININSCS